MPEEDEEKLIRSVALQNAQAVLRARERVERDLIAAKRRIWSASQRSFLSLTTC